MKKLILFSIFFLYNVAFSQWQECNNGLTNQSVYSLGVLNGKIFVGTDVGIFVSSDGGSNWTACNNGITTPKRTTSIKVFGNKIFAGVNGNLYLSEDNGSTWVNKSNGLSVDDREIYLDITQNKMFLGKYAVGMYYSEDFGNTWIAKNNNLTKNSIFAVAIQGNNVFCGTNSSGIFLLEESLGYWTNVLTNSSILTFLCMDYGIFAGSYGGGVYFSSNGGKKWFAKNEGIPWNTKVYSYLSEGNYIFTGSEKGVYVSDDKGDFWKRMSDGIPTKANYMDNNVQALAVVGDNIFAGTFSGGVYKAKLTDVENIGLDTIRLTIKDQMTSKPIQNAEVYLRYEAKDGDFTKFILDTTDQDGKVIFFPNYESGPFDVSIFASKYQNYGEVYQTYDELKYRKEIFIGQYKDIPSYIKGLNKDNNDVALTSGPITVYAENDLEQRTGIIYPEFFWNITNAQMFYKWKGNPMALVLPRRDYYSFNLVPTGDGDYTFEIWKTLKGSSSKYLKYIGKVINNIITKVPGKIVSENNLNCWINLNSDTTKNNYNLYIDLNGDNFPEDSLQPVENITTGIDDNLNQSVNSSFSLYPNPANDVITLVSENELPLGEIKIYNLQGELVMEGNYPKLNANINLAKLPPGIYIIRKESELKTIIKE